MNNHFWDNYYQRPLSRVPWQQTQADWFYELLHGGKLVGETALDLGCGTGMKSIALAQQGGFTQVLGVDIAEQAIAYSQKNAKDAGVADHCRFLCTDAADWSFVPHDTTFDLILDWALLHCLPDNHAAQYMLGIHQHSRAGTLLLLRTFSTEAKDLFFEETVDGMTQRITFYSRKDIERFLPKFTVLEEHRSLPKTKSAVCFTELLMQKQPE